MPRSAFTGFVRPALSSVVLAISLFLFSWSFVWVYSVRRQGVSDRGLCGYHKARQGGEEGGGGARLGEMDGVGVLA